MVHECGICWTVYDPAIGDAAAQIPAQTPFTALPPDWHCPNCAAPKDRFLPREGCGTTPPARSVDTIASAVRAAYLAADDAMRALPIHNPLLGFETIGFRTYDGAVTGIAVTPWCMVLLRVPLQPTPDLVRGATVVRTYPSGDYDFVVGELPGVGLVESCSLFSPVHEFSGPYAARSAAVAAMEALFSLPLRFTPQASRRALLFGGSS